MQWGPNATTWLLPSELFPTEIRALAHGVSAAAGKVGALIAGLAFAHITVQWQFGASAICGIIGVFVTLLFVPDVSALDISELDKRWAHLKAGTAHQYTGPAVAKEHLSVWELMTGTRTAQELEVYSAGNPLLKAQISPVKAAPRPI